MTLIIRHRQFDYLQLHWLEKTSGRPRHEWDLYILKELLDNALAADEQWMREQGSPATLTINLHYKRLPAVDIHSLDIAVTNQAPFPTDPKILAAIFDLASYTSTKGHLNAPSRGQQGNALKTVLGIPYALRHYHYGDYANIHKPLVIEARGQACTISLEIDETRQSVSLAPIQPSPLAHDRPDTCVKVGIDRFVQEKPRTLADLSTWARRFALFNPHITFHWQVCLGGEQATWTFQADPDWQDLFTDTPPVQWYEYTQLRELLLALARRSGPDTSLSQALQTFAGFTPEDDPEGQRAESLCRELDFYTLGDLRLATDHAQTLRNKLLPALLRQGRSIPAKQLGGLGETAMVEKLQQFFDLEEPPLYQHLVHEDPTDPAHPFVLEVALARLPAEHRRVIWTGLNHTPTYEDPFFTRKLYPPVLEDEGVFGLDGVLDTYEQTADQPVLLVLHLICPNLAYQDFAKIVIETRPFREPLSQLLDKMLTEFTAVPEIEDLQPTVHVLLPEAIQLLTPDGWQRFTGSQLLRVVRRLLAEYHSHLVETWLAEPGADARLQGYIQAYSREHPQALTNLIQPERGHLALPLHPDEFRSLAFSQINRSIFDETCVNKLLLVTDPELETLIIANGLLARFDAVILQIEDDFESSFEALLPHLGRLNLPLVLLHHATPSGCILAERLRLQLDQADLAYLSLYDLGLTPGQGLALGLPAEPGPGGGDRTALSRNLEVAEVNFLVEQRQQMSLLSLATEELITWMEQQFEVVGLPAKSTPNEDQLRAIAIETMKRSITDWVIVRFHQAAGVDFLADQVIQLLDLTVDDLFDPLHQSIESDPRRAWRTVWNDLASEQCQDISKRREEEIEKLILEYREKQ